MKAQVLKKFSKADFEDIKELYRQFSPDRAVLDVADFKKFLKSSSDLFVIRDNDHIVGMTTVGYLPTASRTDAHFDDVFVSESHRGQGLSKLLMAAMLEKAKEKGVTEIHCTSRPERTAAVALYEKMGFEKKETNFYRIKL